MFQDFSPQGNGGRKMKNREEADGWVSEDTGARKLRHRQS